MKNFTDLIMFFFVGCLVVLIVTRAEGFATAVTAFATGVRGLGEVLTGQTAGRQATGGAAVIRAVQRR